MIKLIMSKLSFKHQDTYSSKETLREFQKHQTRNVDINTLLNRVKINQKKDRINKLTILALSSLSLLIMGLIVF